MIRTGRQRGRRRTGAVVLRMTSMMDILTVLLLFLLKSFVVEGEVITPVPGVELPESSSEKAPTPALVVAVFDDTVMLDGKVVARVGAAPAGDLAIPGLADALAAARGQERDLARRRGEDADAPGHVAIQGDRDIRFDVLERVMHTCQQSGYRDISLAVLGEA